VNSEDLKPVKSCFFQVSLHCVQAYGHLRDALSQLSPDSAPPRIMLHSYGGSPDMVRGFLSLGRQQQQQQQQRQRSSQASCISSQPIPMHASSNKITREIENSDVAIQGGRVSADHDSEVFTDNVRRLPVGERIYFSFSAALSCKSPKKAAERITAVPADRILLETDLTCIDGMHEGLIEIAEFVAKVKGWTVEQTVEQTWRNFERFYAWEARAVC
jgi:Tat protein secretion system quality control protein TatD with DNase activity